ELRGDKNVLGEFMEFKGKHEDMPLLKKVKRSKVSRFVIQKSTLFGGFGKPCVLCLLAILFCTPHVSIFCTVICYCSRLAGKRLCFK
uniref:Uncharacterized protein n=1 Tax=Aegilops tauschii subsp. strangulata TaxID=200361 RepID=A0A452YQT0_AEGTS